MNSYSALSRKFTERTIAYVPAAVMLALLGLVAGFHLVAQYLQTPLDLWPDVVCQAYIGWRLTEGDSLYLNVWESHPPVAVFYAALVHLFAPPSMGTAISMVLATSVLFAAAQALLMHVRGMRSAWMLLSIAVLMGGAYSALFANARSEDFVIILGTVAIAAAYRFAETGAIRWAHLAGGVLAVAAFSKPAAIASGVVAASLILSSKERVRGALHFALAGGAVGALFLLYFLDDQRYAAAFDQVVVYGRAYFRPVTADVLHEGLKAAFSGPTVGLALMFVTALVLSMPWLIHTRRWIPIVLWPLAELGLSLLQTSYFPYVFFPFQASLLSASLFLVAGTLLARPVNAAATGYSQRLHRSAASAGLVLIVLGTALLGQRAAVQRAEIYENRNVELVEFASVIKRHRDSFEHRFLWLDAAPAIAYLSGTGHVIPEYVSSPLFVLEYTDDGRWQRVDEALASTDLVTVWTEWFDPVSPIHDVWRYPSFVSMRNRLLTEFDKVGEYRVYKDRAPVAVYIRKNTLGTLRSDLVALSGRAQSR